MNDTDLLGKPETKTLTKADLVSCLFSRLGLNKQEAREIVEVFFDEIRAALEQGESVKLSGFGHFQLRDKSPRPGRNPKTGDVVPVSGRRVVTFRVSPKMRCFLEGAGVSAPAEGRA